MKSRLPPQRARCARIPWGPLTAQDDLTLQMAQMGGGADFVSLLDRFTGDATMVAFLAVYIVPHLAAYVILGIALARAHAVPVWAAGALVLTSALTLVAFLTHQQGLLLVVIGLLMAGSVPATLAPLPTQSGCRWPLLITPDPARDAADEVAFLGG